MPKIIKYQGSLYKRVDRATAAPEKLRLTEDFGKIGLINIDGRGYTLPEFLKMQNLRVRGNLNLEESELRELPAGLSVDGHLDLYASLVPELPAGLIVGGFLDLEDSEVRELPPGLIVGGDLYVGGTAITELPLDLVVRGFIYCDSGQFENVPPKFERKVVA